MSNPSDYTVGWICAIATEYAAARCFLDEQHPSPDPTLIPRNDDNHYTLGRVGEHNVVVAALPTGEYGLVSAASVARDMVRSFPNVRIGLMVGIGGGAPTPKNDIRLGDVVISTPGGGKGGVFQYDMGKALQDRGFKPTGFLNQPPRALLTALTGLKTQYEEGHDIGPTIDKILQTKKKMRKTYGRPDSDADVLYVSDFVHSDPEAECAAVCGDDRETVRQREARDEEEDDDPAIHYGLIASGNQVMKDASIRDRLATEQNVLCFEMEAAGLMNHFPCLVIRGICDYSDSHKNKRWQGYAAMTAAACAKDLLAQVRPGAVMAEKRIAEILAKVNENVEEIKTNVAEMRRKQGEAEERAILDWISPGDAHADQQSDYFKRHQEGTGQWLLDSEEYRAWLTGRGETLFRWGMPGAGKTVLTSIVVNHLLRQQQPSVGVAYVYCNFQRQDSQKVEDLLSVLLKQLTLGLSSLPETVWELYETHSTKTRTPPSAEGILQCLKSVIASSKRERTFIVVDALDECLGPDGDPSDLMVELFRLQDICGVNLFVTSRPIPVIMRKFSPRVSAEIKAHETDVVQYLNGHMSRLPRFVMDTHGLVDYIKQEIMGAVRGMFLLAKLYLDIVAAKHNENGIRTALRSLTHATDSCDSSCEDAYGRAYADSMARIDGSDPDKKAFARDILSWIVCARRPLTELELRHALAVDPGNRGDLDFGNLSNMESILSACASLVTVDSESGIVRLVHPTAYDYLRKKGTASSPEAHARIAGICAIYLSFDAFATGACPTDADFERRLRMHPLYQYAARNWGHHASRAGPAVPTEVVAFLRAGGRKLDAATQALFAYTPTANNNTTHAHRQPGYSKDVPRLRTGLQLAACVGASDVIAELLRTLPPDSIGSVVNETDDAGRSPLAWAAEYGHEGVVARLLDSGEVHVKRAGHNGRTPLSIAAGRGAEGVVRLLLSRGGDAGVRDVDDAGMTALAWAAEGGHGGVVQLLLEAMVDKIPQNTSRCMPSDTLKDSTAPDTSQHDAQHTPRYNTRYNARHSAQHTHSDNIPEDTPKDTPKPTPKAKDLLIPLQSAIDNGHETIVQQLVNAARSDPNWEDHYGPKALHQAAASGSVASVQCILASSAAIDVDSAAEDDDDDRNNSGRTPLMTAAQHGHAELVTTLLSTTRALPQWKDRSLRTALSLAAAEGQDAVVELLLADGRVEVDEKDHEGKTALFWAVTNRYDDTARLLLEHGKAAVDAENRYGQTSLAVALDNGDGAMVELLREFGAADVKPGASMDDMFSRIQLAFHAVQVTTGCD